MFSGASKQFIVDLISTVDEHHLLVCLEEEHKVTHKKPSLKSVAKKAIGEVRQVTEKTEFSSKFEDVFDMDYSAPLPKSHKKARGHLSAQVGSLPS